MNETFEELLKQHENTHFLEDGCYIEKLHQELQRKDNIINNITKYVRTFKTDEITTRELCILNDILLITEEKENIVARLKEKSGE